MANTSLLGSYGGQDNSALMFRNRIINGDMRIAQRGNVALSNNAVIYGGCDRTFVIPIGFTTATGTALQSTFAGSTSGKGQFAGSLTTTGTGKVIFVQRIESQNVNDLNGQNVTFSGKIAHDIGTTQSVILRITKANALDAFGTVTTILQQTISVPSGVTTSFTLTALLGATDANNGLGVEIEFNLGAISSKNMGVSDLQLEAGPVATPFERRPFGTELALCQRYYERLGGGGGDLYKLICISTDSSATSSAFVIPYRVEKRIPNITFSFSGSFAYLVGSGTFSSFAVQADGRTTSQFSGNVVGTGFTTGAARFTRTNNDANAFLAFEAEL